METRHYYVESRKHKGEQFLHAAGCSDLPAAERFFIGIFAQGALALTDVRTSFPDIVACPRCCPECHLHDGRVAVGRMRNADGPGIASVATSSSDGHAAGEIRR